MNKEYKIFLKEYDKLMISYNNDLEKALEKARDKSHTLSILEGQYHQLYRKSEQTLIDADLNNFFRTFDEALSMDKTLSEADAFKNNFQTYDAECNKENALLLANHKAIKDFKIIIMKKMTETSQTNISDKKPKIKYWIGTESTEFVQLIYGLIEAGRLQSKNKTEMVETIADFLGIELSKEWQSNLSKSVHDRNNDYEPKIFKDILTGWLTYSKSLNK
jgi:hypothetical protein